MGTTFLAMVFCWITSSIVHSAPGAVGRRQSTSKPWQRPALTLTSLRFQPSCRIPDPPDSRSCWRISSKKARWLCLKEKRSKASSRSKKSRPASARACRSPSTSVINLVHIHTGEVLPVLAGRMPQRRIVEEFLRCRWTNRKQRMDLRVLRVILDTAVHFKSDTVKIVSAFRHPKFNEYLRKKCRQVARRSKHTMGTAIDFEIEGVEVEAVYRYLKALRFGGVGRYPSSRFIHLDSGPVRVWSGG